MWVVAIKSEGKSYYLVKWDLYGLHHGDPSKVELIWEPLPHSAERFESLERARRLAKIAIEHRALRATGVRCGINYPRHGDMWNPSLPTEPKVYRRAKKGLVAAAGSLQVAGRLLGEIKTQDVQVAQLAGAVKQIRLAVVKMLPRNLRRTARSGKRACVTPNGRTDGHGTYARHVNGVMVCEFCREPIAS